MYLYKIKVYHIYTGNWREREIEREKTFKRFFPKCIVTNIFV